MPLMSRILDDPKAKQDSVLRMCEARPAEPQFELNHGVRGPEELHRIILAAPFRIDRQELAEAALSSFGSDREPD
jgi:hypothetical protein